MKKLFYGLVIGLALATAVFLGPLSVNTALGNPGSSELPEPADDYNGSEEIIAEVAEVGREALMDALDKAGESIRDKEILEYYLLLIDNYQLEELSSENSSSEQYSPAGIVPDIYQINRAAASLPLIEAGKNIEDEDIAGFYSRFLKSTGWTTE